MDHLDSLISKTESIVKRWHGHRAQMVELTKSHAMLRIVVGDETYGQNLLISCLGPVHICGPLTWLGSEIVLKSAPLASGKEGVAISDVSCGLHILAESVEVGENVKWSSIAEIRPQAITAKPDGTPLAIELLRPLVWMKAAGVEPGATVDLQLSEMGVHGPAEILAVGPCPPLEARAPTEERRHVTGRFIHESPNRIDLRLQDIKQPIGTTATHPFWSMDRQEFIPAVQLRPGELLQTREGRDMRVKSITPRPSEIVYNIEVQTEHVYFVTDQVMLVHNMCVNAADSGLINGSGNGPGRFEIGA